MDNGQIVIINKDDNFKCKTEFPVFTDINEFVSTDIFNYNLDKINKKLFKKGLDGLEKIHENFTLIVWTRSIINLDEYRSGKISLGRAQKEDIF